MIDTSWALKDVIENIETLKSTYVRSLASFSYFDKKSKLRYMQKIKAEIYNIKTVEWRKNIIWNYINSNECKEPLRYLLGELDTK